MSRLLGLPAFAVELRFTAVDADTGRLVEHVQLHKPYVEKDLAEDEFARLRSQGGDQFGPHSRWRLLLLNLAEGTRR